MASATLSMTGFDAKRSRCAGIATYLFLALAVSSPGPRLNAQPSQYGFVEVRTIAGPCCTDEGTDLAVDSEGGVLVAGKRGSLDLDRDGTIDVKTWGSPDPLVSKLVLSGKVNSGWTADPGGPRDDVARGIASDRHGGAYAVGEFNGSSHFGRDVLQSAGLHDGFLVHYRRDGLPLWSKAIGGTGRDVLQDVATDSAGNAVVIGTIKGAVDVDSDGVVDVTGNPAGTAVIASFGPEGDFRWARISRGAATVTGQAIAIGPNDEIYVGGSYQNGAPDFDGDGKPDGPLAVAASGASSFELNAFYARLDASGQVSWIRTVSGPGVQLVGSLAVAGNGDLLVLGAHTAPADVDGDGVADITFKSMGERKARLQLDGNNFLLRVSPDGKGVWAQRYMAGGAHVAAAASRIAISGTYTETLDFDDDGVPERAADPDQDLEGFVAILDDMGEVQQVLTVVGQESDVVNAAGFSSDGQYLYYTGFTRQGADFDGDGRIETATVCHQLGDIYLATFRIAEPGQ